jgi:hypothetical protein
MWIEASTLDWQEAAEEAHKNAIEKGWWEKNRTWFEARVLIVSELIEALEAWRDGNIAVKFVAGKPEGIIIELADAVIRIFDWCVHDCIPVAKPSVVGSGVKKAADGSEQNRTLSVPECLDAAIEALYGDDAYRGVNECLSRIERLVKILDKNLDAAIVIKMNYNRTRPYRHGGKRA